MAKSVKNWCHRSFNNRGNLNLFILLSVCGLMNLFTGSSIIGQPTDNDYISVTETSSTSIAGQTTYTIEFNFVSTPSEDVAMITLRLEVDNINCKVRGLDFSDFKYEGAKVKRTIVHGVDKDYVDFTISLPAGHSLPTTAEVDIEMECVFSPNHNSIGVEVTEATAKVVNGTNAYNNILFML